MHVTLVIPVFNEESQLENSIDRLRRAVVQLSDIECDVVIADNGSSDGTWAVATRLSKAAAGVHAVHLPHKGRGGALREVWLRSTADVVGYMDVDLSTDLRHLPELFGPIARDEADLVIGSRLADGARTRRGWRREILSRGYNALTRGITGSRLRDHQCGFKALRRSVANALLPRVENREWFFDTELLVLAQRHRWRVREFPIQWVDDPDTRVRIIATVVEDLRGLWRLRRTG